MAPRELVHVLGGGPFQLPTIQAARALGCRVLVTDMYRERPGYAVADLHERIDVTDQEGTLAAARRHRVDAIVCDSIDVGVPTAAFVADRLGLPGVGYQTALRFTRKHLMRRALARAGLQATRFRVATREQEAARAAREIGYPVVLKPTDNQGSRGVFRVRDEGSLLRAFPEALAKSRQGMVLVEELFPGTEVIVDSLTVGGETLVLGLADKDHFPQHPTARRITYPATMTPTVQQRLTRLHADIVRALGLRDGFAHGEYMVDGETARLVEVGARGGGSGIFTHVIPHLTGIDTARICVELARGRARRPELHGNGRAANLHFFTLPSGRVQAIEGLPEARAVPGVLQIVLTLGPGDLVAPPRDDSERPGPAIVVGASRDEVLAASRRLDELLRVSVCPADAFPACRPSGYCT